MLSIRIVLSTRMILYQHNARNITITDLELKFQIDIEVHHAGLGAFWTGSKIILGDGDTT